MKVALAPLIYCLALTSTMAKSLSHDLQCKQWRSIYRTQCCAMLTFTQLQVDHSNIIIKSKQLLLWRQDCHERQSLKIVPHYILISVGEERLSWDMLLKSRSHLRQENSVTTVIISILMFCFNREYSNTFYDEAVQIQLEKCTWRSDQTKLTSKVEKLKNLQKTREVVQEWGKYIGALLVNTL